MGFSKVFVSHAGEMDGKSIWRLEKPLNASFSHNGKFYKIFIPEGFLTDFGSIPKFAQSLYSPTDPDMIECFILHDFFYEKNGKILVIRNGKGEMLNLNRYESDLIALWRLAKDEGAGYIKRSIIYNSVRVGGSGAWKNCAKLKRGERFNSLKKHVTQ